MVCWADAAAVIAEVTGAAVVTVAEGPDPVFGSVVHAEAQARRMTSTAKIKEYFWNLMMLNSNERVIFVAISIRLYEKKELLVSYGIQTTLLLVKNYFVNQHQ